MTARAGGGGGSRPRVGDFKGGEYLVALLAVSAPTPHTPKERKGHRPLAAQGRTVEGRQCHGPSHALRPTSKHTLPTRPMAHSAPAPCTPILRQSLPETSTHTPPSNPQSRAWYVCCFLAPFPGRVRWCIQPHAGGAPIRPLKWVLAQTSDPLTWDGHPPPPP